MRILALSLLLVPVLLPACRSSAMTTAETMVAQALISDDDEKKIGQQVHQELDRQKVRYVTDATVTGYVQRIAGPVFAQAAKARPNMDWHVHVVDDPKQVNAFAVPGGHVFVYSGLLKHLKTDSELAGVLAHEAGHVVARHTARSLVQAYGLHAVAQLALGKDPALLQKLGSQIAQQGALLYHSRGDELEADQWGAKLATQAGWDPHGLVSFLGTLMQQQGGQPSEAMTWLSTHPASQDRIAALQATIDQNHWSGKTSDGTTELAAVRTRLGSTMPAGPATQPAPQRPTLVPGPTQPTTPAPPARPNRPDDTRPRLSPAPAHPSDTRPRMLPPRPGASHEPR